MSISITLYPEEGYYVSEYVGAITDAEMQDAFTRFFTGDEWVPGMNELADISKADLSRVTPSGLRALASIVEDIFGNHDFFMKVAVYAPENLSFGMARIYSAHASRFEAHRVFRDLDEAREWLLAGRE